MEIMNFFSALILHTGQDLYRKAQRAADYPLWALLMFQKMARACFSSKKGLRQTLKEPSQAFRKSNTLHSTLACDFLQKARKQAICQGIQYNTMIIIHLISDFYCLSGLSYTICTTAFLPLLLHWICPKFGNKRSFPFIRVAIWSFKHF